MKSRMSLWLIPAVAVGVLAAAAPAQASPGNRHADLLFGAGSDTTYSMMQRLDNLYNGSAGCNVIVADVTKPGALNNTCQTSPAGAPAETTTENISHDVATEYYPQGSGIGRATLNNAGQSGVTTVSYARSSSAIGASDKGDRAVGYARDGISWFHFPDVAGSASKNVTNLTQADLRGIFEGGATASSYPAGTVDSKGCITSWKAFPGGSDAPIVVYAVQAGSGTRSTFDGFLGGAKNSTLCIPAQNADPTSGQPQHVIFENDATPIIKNGDQANAIYYYSFGRYQQTGGEGGSLGSIDGIAPTPATLVATSGAFPFARFLYNVIRNAQASTNASQATQAYVGPTGWICKDNTQHSLDTTTRLNYGVEVDRVIRSEGFVPLPVGGDGLGNSTKCRIFDQS